jgi:hypothetical protein
MYFLQPNINQYEVEVDTTQLYEVDSFNNPAVGKPLAFTLSDLYSPSMTNGNFSGGGPTVSFIQPNGKTPYAYEWNLTIDHTLKNWLFEVAYLGSAGCERHRKHLPSIQWRAREHRIWKFNLRCPHWTRGEEIQFGLLADGQLHIL